MRIIISLFVVVITLLVLPERVAACHYGQYGCVVTGPQGQMWGNGLPAPIYTGWYGGYNGPFVPPFLPFWPRDERDEFGRKLPPIDIKVCQYLECAGMEGTFHTREIDVVFKGKKTKAEETHFRTSDTSHEPIKEGHGTCRPIPSAGYTVRVNGFAHIYYPEGVPQPVQEREDIRPEDSSPPANQAAASPQVDAPSLIQVNRRVEVATPPVAPRDCREQGLLQVQNPTGQRIEVEKDGKVTITLPLPDGSNVACVEKGHSYRAWMDVFVQESKPNFGSVKTDRMPLKSDTYLGVVSFRIP